MEKHFLVQACRQGERPVLGGAAPASPAAPAAGGASNTDGVELGATDDAALLDSLVEGGRLCEEHDFLWAYATTPPPPTPNPNP